MGQPLAQMVAISSWNQEPGDEDQDFQLIIRIHGPGDEPQDFPINFRMTRRRQRAFLRVQGVPAQRPGELKFELLLNSRQVATHTVTVHPSPQNLPALPSETPHDSDDARVATV